MTEKVEIFKTGTGWTIKAWGGYDGFIEKHFTTKEEMLHYVTYLWSF